MARDLYRPVSSQVSFPAMEHAVLDRWNKTRVYERSLEARAGAPEWVFYEGPPTANGKPGLHHVVSRTFKDLFCRFQAMRGHYVHRKGGWDCHGLPVEIEVEKELGIAHKREIEERYGIEEFVRRCRASVQRYVDDWERFTDRLGFWLDLEDAYWTMTPGYIETVWWILKQIWDKGLLEEDFKVVPYCPRCETSLSSHEQHQPGAYENVIDPSVYVRLPLDDEPSTALVVWTTTPWTLLANFAAAVGEDIDYVVAQDPGDVKRRVIVATERLEAVLGAGATPLEHLAGRDLVGRKYRPPFDYVLSEDRVHRVRAGEFVSTEDGTGIVHLAPYGEDDMRVGREHDLPIVQVIDPTGHVSEAASDFAGLWFKDADPRVVEALESSGALLKKETHEHAYPHCWRCKTPLLYYARKDWYIRTSQIRHMLQASNEETNWQPPTIKYGRFGDWLANNVDWSLSRDRYWGTPLPVWCCTEGHATCVGSFAELSERAGEDLATLDPHRPAVDRISFACPECGGEARRVTSVIDAWFDSGSMPFGQWHYPFENEDVFDRRFPADFISEAIDQTRGWFYSLLAVATLIKGHNSYKNVVCLGLLVDAEGRKMSKSLGNVIDPWTVFEGQGADALRWHMITAGTPWSQRRVSVEIIEEALRKFILTLWNTYAFWVTYASIDGFVPGATDVPVTDRPELDRWILAELDDTIRVMTSALDDLDASAAGKRLDRFVDDLSNWYVRRSRRRFWRAGESRDKDAAFLTLWECLEAAARLGAPFTPFVADEIYSNVTGPLESAPDSVHLADWPEPVAERVDDSLRVRMALARRLVTLGRSARTGAKVRVRQPLRRALVVIPTSETSHLENLEAVIADELNVKDISVAVGIEELVSYTLKPNFKSLGPRFGAKVKAVAVELARIDASSFVQALEENGRAALVVDGESVELERADVDVRVEGRTGFAIAQDGPYAIALDVEVTPELAAEGTAREVVRAVQDLRKSAGLEVEDRIRLWLEPSDDGARAALAQHADFIAAEVLATETYVSEPPPEGAPASELSVDGRVIRVALRRTAQ